MSVNFVENRATLVDSMCTKPIHLDILRQLDQRVKEKNAFKGGQSIVRCLQNISANKAARINQNGQTMICHKLIYHLLKVGNGDEKNHRQHSQAL